MNVFLIPTPSVARYELYYEAPEEDVVSVEDAPGFFGRIKLRFASMVKEAEDWRSRRLEMQSEPASLLARLRRKTMGFIVERIAEQRLLWHLRKTTEVCACIPADMSESDADLFIRTMLRQDAERHRKWFWIDLVLLLLTTPLVLIPGPNVPGFYFTFQVVSHYLSWTGAKKGLQLSPWTFESSADLSELRTILVLAPSQRQQRFQELGERLRLEHLATFLEDVAARPA